MTVGGGCLQVIDYLADILSTTACKAMYAGSIPTSASKSLRNDRRQL